MEGLGILGGRVVGVLHYNKVRYSTHDIRMRHYGLFRWECLSIFQILELSLRSSTAYLLIRDGLTWRINCTLVSRTVPCTVGSFRVRSQIYIYI